MRIGAIDDDTGILGLYKAIAKRNEFEVVTLTSPEGIKNLTGIDVFLSDCEMGAYTCEDTRREVEKYHAGTPIVYTSGNYCVLDALHEKGESVINKPFSIPDLVGLIMEAYNGSKKHT